MISVCLAVYNGEIFIAEQINSILIQLGDEDEIVVSDDSSTDNTIKVLDSFNDKRIKILRNPRKKNLIFNFENSLRNAKGDIILTSDHDDIWLPGRVEYYRNRLKEYDMVVTDSSVINAKGEIIHHSFFDLRNSGKGFMKNLLMNTYIGCCLGFKKEMLKYYLPFPKDIPMHDIWMGIVSELTGKVTFDKEVFLLYRRHGNNISTTSEKTKSSIFRLIIYRWNIIKYFPLIFWRKYF